MTCLALARLHCHFEVLSLQNELCHNCPKIRRAAAQKLKCLTFLTTASSCNQISSVFSTVNTQKCKLFLHKKSSTGRELDVPGTYMKI